MTLHSLFYTLYLSCMSCKSCLTILFFLVCTHCLSSHEMPLPSIEESEKIACHLIPDKHPAKAQLDLLFQNSTRIVENKMSLKMAGFKLIKEGKTKPYVLRHPLLPGYVLKLFTDEQKITQEWEILLKRIVGAHLIQEMIDKMGYGEIFKVPGKWLYTIPCQPNYLFPNESYPKMFLLIAEDMQVLSLRANRKLWKSECITPELLFAYYHLISELGLSDSLFMANIPFSEDLSIAFVDTERYFDWPVLYEKVLPRLSTKMKIYWKKLTRE